jgi:hypothetical protein
MFQNIQINPYKPFQMCMFLKLGVNLPFQNCKLTPIFQLENDSANRFAVVAIFLCACLLVLHHSFHY